LIKNIKLIERVQRRATKLVEGIGNWSYDERLKYLGLTRLDTSRVRSSVREYVFYAFFIFKKNMTFYLLFLK